MSMILQFLFSLSMAAMSGLRCSISLSAWKSPKVFYICHSPRLALVDVKTICFQSQISCPGASVLFFRSLLCLYLYWFPARTEHELTIWVTLSTFSLQSLHRGASPGLQCHFLLYLC